jgi:hypothetical protein
MTSVSQETHAKASQFANPMEKMLDLIDTLRFSEDQRMNDGMYLEMMNTICEINKLKTEVKTSVIYREAVRQSHAPISQPRRKAIDMLDDPAYMSCPDCKKPMTIRHYKEKHSGTKNCHHIKTVRDINKIKGTGNTKSKTMLAKPQLRGFGADVEAITVILTNDSNNTFGRRAIIGDETREKLQIPTCYESLDKGKHYVKKGSRWKALRVKKLKICK